MSEVVHWIKTGERGARAEFTDSDLVTALLLIKENPMGRYKLQTELKLSDSSTKSLLNFCKKKGLLEAKAGRSGHNLAKKGKEFVNQITKLIVKHEKCDQEVFPAKQHYFVILNTNEKNLEQNDVIIKPSWKLRDIVISYGGDAILFLEVNSDGKIQFPEEDIKIENYFPKFETEFIIDIEEYLQPMHYILIVGATELEIARKSAIIAGLNLVEKYIKYVHQEI
ncbi:MAG: hypothetical protein GPJ52_00225 [Candidatus Heimdallarchaeota archaeon]|nr:hypothetical protein [Candidatus Heimdallarchaeota archaeon]MCG3253076.1 hypothetical protein [Candidatus Heimdallarchaeota archaeon]MCK4290213.1 hypothetical protein [Candidatus Heimdallarchaeota archaeon]